MTEAENAPWRQWGDDHDDASIQQMRRACELPIAVRGALMPDAHLGYGLPIGGVLATRNAVIPYAVGVDIACRMKLSVWDMPPDALDIRAETLTRAIEAETRFGIGASFKHRRRHRVMDDDWSITPVTERLKDKAWSQLGTSGSGNHFVEFGVLELDAPELGLDAGRYLALLSHSGSRGVGNAVARHFSELAAKLRPDLPRGLRHLAWLDLETEAGNDYWRAMLLMGRYAAANHELIHRHLADALGIEVIAGVENHHNFAWLEKHDGERLVVHRKGATPADKGTLGIIPGSMATPAYIVRGRGSEESLRSASHGAGRRMSRKQAKKAFSWSDIKATLRERRIRVLSAGLDEVPMAYKDIETVMAAQRDLVLPVARFHPRLVKMAPGGEPPED
jgi:tRNA-splicing ligase RtcB